MNPNFQIEVLKHSLCEIKSKCAIIIVCIDIIKIKNFLTVSSKQKEFHLSDVNALRRCIFI